MVLLEFKTFDFPPPAKPNLIPKFKYASIFMKTDTMKISLFRKIKK